jgi:hypothetical protein
MAQAPLEITPEEYTVGGNTVEVVVDPTAEERKVAIAEASARPKIPNRLDYDVEKSLKLDRTSDAYKPTGSFAMTLKALRIRDRENLTKAKIGNVQPGALSWIGYVPNSRYMYVHQLINRLLEGDQISNVDVEFLQTFWMPKDQKAKMAGYFRNTGGKHYSATHEGFTVVPPPSTLSKGYLMPEAKGNQLKMISYVNPGFINLDITKDIYEAVTNALSPDQYVTLNNAIHHLVMDSQGTANMPDVADALVAAFSDIRNKIRHPFDYFGQEELQFFNPHLIRSLVDLYDAIERNELSVSKLTTIVKTIRMATQVSEDLYLSTLVDPIGVTGVKGPTTVPFPTSCFQVTFSSTLTSNAGGYVAFGLCPLLLTSASTHGILAINNDETLDGTATNANFDSTDCELRMPGNLFSEYRCVSGRVEMVPITAADENSGYMGLALAKGFGNLSAILAADIVAYDHYADFTLIDNAYFARSGAISEGSISLNYVPTGDQDLDYHQLSSTYTATSSSYPPFFVGYVSGATGSIAVVKVKFTFNFEGKVAVSYRDYIPASPNLSSSSLSSVFKMVDPKEVALGLAEKPQSHEASALADPRVRLNPLSLDRMFSVKNIPLPVRSALERSWEILKKELKHKAPTLLKSVAKALTKEVPVIGSLAETMGYL